MSTNKCEIPKASKPWEFLFSVRFPFGKDYVILFSYYNEKDGNGHGGTEYLSGGAAAENRKFPSKPQQIRAESGGVYPGKSPGIIDLSVAALADACGVSDPTVVRAYKKLGFSGYEDLKLTLAQATVSPDEIIHEEISAEDSVQAVRDKVFQSAVLALQFTRDMLEPETLAAAAQLLMNARKIVIFGLGGSAPVAMDLHHKLLRLGLNAAVYTDPHLQVIACNYLDERDAVFAVSHSGSSRCVVDSTQTAKHRGQRSSP
ncbi:MAG: MurR/RpiR family transcriptional regulator [Oscillospiraceae bacterium]